MSDFILRAQSRSRDESGGGAAATPVFPNMNLLGAEFETDEVT